MDAGTKEAPAFSRDLYLLSGTFFFVFMGAGAQQAYLVPYLGKVASWTPARASLVIASVYAAMLVFRVANLHLFPHWSDRAYTIAGSVTYLGFTLAMFATGYVRSFSLALCAAWIWGAGAALMWTGTAMQTLALSDRAGGRHGTGMGILYASTHGGWLAGAIFLGLIYRSLSLEQLPLLYLAAAGVTLIGNVLACCLPASGRAVREPPSLAAIWGILCRRRALIAGTLQFTSALAYGIILAVFGAYIQSTHGAGWIWISVSLYPATRMVMSFVGGRLTDRLGYSPVLVGGFLAGAAGLFLTVVWQSPLAAVAAGLALGLLSSTIPVVASALVGNAAEKQRRPLAYGVLFTWRDLGVVAGAVGSSQLGTVSDLRTVFIVFIYVFAGCALLSGYLGRFASEEL